jgi:replication initiation protein RepC
MMAAQAAVDACPLKAIAEKWRVLDNLREAKSAIGVSDRALSTLNALLTFHQEKTLRREADLIVFPSNRALSLRASGMTPATLRRNLAALVDAGLIIRRDSPNGKRYARRGEGGQIERAFGFDLSPLVARAEEFEKLARTSRAQARTRSLRREEISLLRRDISKTIQTALNEGQSGPWHALADRLHALGAMPPRHAEQAILDAVAAQLRILWEAIDKHRDTHTKIKNSSTNESQNERHHQNSKTDPIFDSETGFRERPSETPSPERGDRVSPPRTYPLSLVLQACPDIGMYMRGGSGISSWREFHAAVDVVRLTLRIGPGPWAEACEAMGDERACITLATILQRAEVIRNPGAYLRHLTNRSRAGQFSLEPLLMALIRSAKTLSTGQERFAEPKRYLPVAQLDRYRRMLP